MPNLDIWHAWCLHFGVRGDPGTILGHWGAQERTLWGQGLDFNRFLVHLGTPFREFFGYLGQKKVYYFMLASRLLFLMILGSESGCLGWEDQVFGIGCIAKINFRSTWISHDPRVQFSWFWVALGVIFMTFAALETGLKFNDFQDDSGVTPDPKHPPGWG